MMALWQDARYALRMVVRSRGYAVVMVLTLALGIGATTAIFSLVNGILLRPLAYPQSQQLVFVDEFIPEVATAHPTVPVNARHFLEWRQRCSSFETLALLDRSDMILTGPGEPQRLEALEVSADLFDVLRVRPVLGRAFTREDESTSSHVAVISDKLWRQEFGADPVILGRTITLDDEAYAVIGILSPAFRLPNIDRYGASRLVFGSRPDVLALKVFTERERNALMGDFSFGVIGRLKESVTCAQATSELNVIQAQLIEMAGWKIGLQAMVEPLKEVSVHNSRRGLLVLLGAIGTLLLIACLNLGILSLARAQRREAESALRAALGATRPRLVRQALVETVLIAFLGSVAGVALATEGLAVLVRMAPADLPRLGEVSMDAGVLAFALGLTGATALLFGMLPVWRVAGVRAEQVLQMRRRTATTGVGELGLRNVLVAAEVGLGVALLITAGLLLDSFARVIRADLGFQAPRVLAAEVALSPAKYRDQAGGRFYDRLLTELASTPGIDCAAIVNALPLEGEVWVDSVGLPGDPKSDWERPRANMRFISSGYFQTLGISLLEGRTFDDTDRNRRTVVMSQQLARALWPQAEAAVGRKVLVSDQEWEVIGVANDVRAHADRAAPAILYRAHWMVELESMRVVARTRGDPLSLAGAVRAAAHKVDAGVPVTKVRTIREVLAESVSQRRFQVLLTSTFALCALLLAGLGVYGVVSYSVTRRTGEMGIRAALGARAPQLCVMVLRQGMTPVVVGLIPGVAGALAGGRLLQSLLYEVKPYDPWIIASVVGVMLLTAVLSCYLPARRAARIDPMVALRCE